MSDATADTESLPLFLRIADELRRDGYSIIANALPIPLADALCRQIQDRAGLAFCPAGIGRGNQFSHNNRVRRDNIAWMDGSHEAEKNWLAWMASLQLTLNRELLLGLFSYESHFAHYPPGAFYRKHVDAFRGQTNRVLSTVTYLNRDWQANDGGELLIYSHNGQQLATVLPEFATLVVFLSEDFPHEVLPARHDRFSVAGWFRVNTSIPGRVDPPS
ncbi:MAG TPA: 2OG-Fe(II) oxygenase [Pseudomonadales bacterium]